MKFGMREVADVMVKTRVANQKVGGQVIPAKGTPICHFDSLKTSSLEQAASTVYAQGGRGNSRLVAWEGDKTLTLTMEDALISKAGLALLTGANLIDISLDANVQETIVHVTEICEVKENKINLFNTPAEGQPVFYAPVDDTGTVIGAFKTLATGNAVAEGLDAVLVDYYVKKDKTSSVLLVDIEETAFGGNFYFEGSTLWRDGDGRDYPAEFIIPNGHIQSNFTFAMSSTGDPSTFTFTVDAFPGTTVYNKKKRVLAAMQIIDETTENVTSDSVWLDLGTTNPAQTGEE